MDPRKRILLSLDTYALEEACLLRDQLVEVDNQYWAALELEAMGNGHSRQVAKARYKAAIARAQSAGFSYRPVLEIAKQEPIEQTVERLLLLKGKSDVEDISAKPAVEALIGGVERPKVRLSEALEI